MLFIVIHQVYELWFKQLLHELAHLQRRLEMGDSSRALGTLKRVLTILKTIVAQIDVLETMTPAPVHDLPRPARRAPAASSRAQFRELEAVLGRRDARRRRPLPARVAGARAARATRWRARACSTPSCATWRAGLRRPARGARARRHPAGGPVAGGAGRARRRLPRRRPEAAGLRAPGRSRRGPSGVALPPRQDGRAHDRRQGRAPAARRAPSTCARRSSTPPSPTCGPCAEPRCDTPTCARRTAGAHYRASASPSGCCSPGTRTRRGPTSRSRASVEAFDDAARHVDEKWGRAFAKAERGARRLPRAARRPRRRDRARRQHPRARRALALGARPATRGRGS